MRELKAIQTEYKGYLFRSRLEVRWAVFFDACGMEWEYDPEGYDLGDGMGEILDNLQTAAYCDHHNWPNFYNFETVDGDYFGAYPGVDKHGKFNLFGDDSKYNVHEHCSFELIEVWSRTLYQKKGGQCSFYCKLPENRGLEKKGSYLALSYKKER